MPSDNVRPYRQCGYCHTWNTRPCGEQCAWSPGDPPFSEQQPLVDGELFAVVHLNTIVTKLAKGEATTEDYAQARERLIAALRAPQETGWQQAQNLALAVLDKFATEWDEHGLVRVNEPYSWETAARVSLDILRSIAKPTAPRPQEAE